MKSSLPAQKIENHEGIKVQAVSDAILSSQHIVMLDRLLAAAREAAARNLLDAAERERITRELYRHD